MSAQFKLAPTQNTQAHTYIVQLSRSVDGLVDTVTDIVIDIVIAKDACEAFGRAITKQSHGELQWINDVSATDMGGDILLEIDRVIRVQDEDVQIVRRYL